MIIVDETKTAKLAVVSVISLIIAFLILPCQALAADEFASIEITGQNVEVKFGPGIEQPILGTASLGEVYELLDNEMQNQFYAISYKSATGYVQDEYAALTDKAPASNKDEKKVIFRGASSSSENIRSQPNSSSKVLGKLVVGMSLPLLDTKTSNNYYKVSYNGNVGYVHTMFADVVEWLPKQPVYSQYSAYIKVTDKSQRVYESIGGRSAGTVYRGDILPAASANNGYYETIYDGKAAYISQGSAVSIKPEPLPSNAPSWIALVSIAKQTVTVYHNGELARFMSCSTGASSTPTPKGTFRVPYRKEYFISHSLTCFDAVKIVDSTGIYFHRIPRNPDGTYSGFQEALGSRASAGCVRLPEVHSRWMYANFPNGGTVVIK